ncbi:hypothetical protein, partial [Pseudomonas aeruginosa]|uniref:hypothetical protein n=1 Tax=Pseudomonas aeruginosa TaxID=287 RepID=UPI001E5367DD
AAAAQLGARRQGVMPVRLLMNAEKLGRPCVRMAHCQQNTLPRYRCFIVVASPDLAEKPAP